jgi:hypothetical protein
MNLADRHFASVRAWVKKYGLLPEKDAEAMPWDRLCINLIGPYNIKSNIKEVKIPPLKCICTMHKDKRRKERIDALKKL